MQQQLHQMVFMTDSSWKKVITFLALTFALSTPFYYFIISAGTLGAAGGLYVDGIMWCPGIAALLTRIFFQRNLRGIGWGWGKTRYQVQSYLLPLLAGLIVYGIVWMTDLGGFTDERLTRWTVGALGQDAASLPLAILLAGTVGFLQSALFTTGEELGWRGLLVPELAKLTGYTKISVISAILWALYHYPVLIFSDYNSAAPIWHAFLFFTVCITGASFILAWLRLKSGSVWTAVIFHSSHNLFIQNVYDGLTVDKGYTQYITTEFGAGLAVVYTLVAYWCWRRRGELYQDKKL